jgi:hypothetical protein
MGGLSLFGFELPFPSSVHSRPHEKCRRCAGTESTKEKVSKQKYSIRLISFRAIVYRNA